MRSPSPQQHFPEMSKKRILFTATTSFPCCISLNQSSQAWVLRFQTGYNTQTIFAHEILNSTQFDLMHRFLVLILSLWLGLLYKAPSVPTIIVQIKAKARILKGLSKQSNYLLLLDWCITFLHNNSKLSIEHLHDQPQG